MKTVGIYIPTRGREGKQVTRRHLNDEIIVVHPEGEVHDAPCLVSPIEGMGPKRQWILENTKEDIILMLDDDLILYERDAEWEFEVYEQLNKLVRLDRLIEWIQSVDFIHGSISARQSNRGHIPDKSPGRATCVLWYHRKCLDLGIDFTKIPAMSDFYTSLQMMELGYPNIVSHQFCYNQASGTKGGCSIYRTKETMVEAANILKARFPDVVTIVERETKGDGVFGGVRTDVRIDWRHAVK